MGICDTAKDKTSQAIDSVKSSVKDLLNDENKYFTFSSDVFDKYDKDKSGYIEQTELKEVINELAKKLNQETKVSEDVVKAALDHMDTDTDGKISRDEFCKTSRNKLMEKIFNN